ncbi:hypothetical protein BX600DRAFT_460872 [Xylariales sp. PMI_506]|nr:hypothetical protein BX600DRAFT_460872 [Xylariales sp. PMI_506]
MSMETVDSTATSMSAPYGYACANCAKSKCKCITRGGGKCERCHRRGLDCRPSEAVRKRGMRKGAGTSKTSQLERRLEDLVTLLQSQQRIAASPALSQGPGPESAAQQLEVGQLGQPSALYASSTGGSSTHSPELSVNLQGQSTLNPLCPTPPSTAPVSCLSSQASPPSNLSVTDLLPAAEAERILDTFKTYSRRFFPVVYFKPDISAVELQRDRPFLWLNIRATVSKSSEEAWALGEKIRRLLAHSAIVELDRELDLLLGLLIYLGWSTRQTRGKGFLVRFANLANSFLSDLRLDRPPDISTSNNCWYPLKSAAPPAYLTNDHRRAVLGTYIISSSIGDFLRVDITRWTAYMDESLRYLAENPDWPGDELLVAIVRVKFIVEEAGSVSWKRADYEKSAPPDIYIKPLLDRLDQFKSDLPPALAEDDLLLSHIYNAELVIREMAAFHPVCPVSIPHGKTSFPPSSLPIPPLGILKEPSTEPTLHPLLRPLSLDRLKLLVECLESVKRNIGNYFKFPPKEYPGFPFAMFCHFSHSIQTLYRLSMLDEPDWDRAAVRRSADLTAILGEAADKVGSVPASLGLSAQDSMGDFYTRASSIMRVTSTVWGANLDQALNNTSEAPNLANTVEQDFSTIDANSSDTMPMMMDIVSDGWLTDLFASWEA